MCFFASYIPNTGDSYRKRAVIQYGLDPKMARIIFIVMPQIATHFAEPGPRSRVKLSQSSWLRIAGVIIQHYIPHRSEIELSTRLVTMCTHRSWLERLSQCGIHTTFGYIFVRTPSGFCTVPKFGDISNSGVPQSTIKIALWEWKTFYLQCNPKFCSTCQALSDVFLLSLRWGDPNHQRARSSV